MDPPVPIVFHSPGAPASPANQKCPRIGGNPYRADRQRVYSFVRRRLLFLAAGRESLEAVALEVLVRALHGAEGFVDRDDDGRVPGVPGVERR